jgi:polyisoprenoid-binding protein YceI
VPCPHSPVRARTRSSQPPRRSRPCDPPAARRRPRPAARRGSRRPARRLEPRPAAFPGLLHRQPPRLRRRHRHLPRVRRHVAFDPDDIEATEVTLTIDAASIDTLWEARDEHIRSADFLDVANHPEITFVSTGLTLIDDATAELAGDLTIRGETRPVTLEATLNNIGPNPFNPDQEIAGFTITGEVDRTEFGIDFGAPVIGAVLPVTVNVELTRTN